MNVKPSRRLTDGGGREPLTFLYRKRSRTYLSYALTTNGGPRQEGNKPAGLGVGKLGWQAIRTLRADGHLRMALSVLRVT